jgi:hypothetical protein
MQQILLPLDKLPSFPTSVMQSSQFKQGTFCMCVRLAARKSLVPFRSRVNS